MRIPVIIFSLLATTPAFAVDLSVNLKDTIQTADGHKFTNCDEFAKGVCVKNLHDATVGEILIQALETPAGPQNNESTTVKGQRGYLATKVAGALDIGTVSLKLDEVKIIKDAVDAYIANPVLVYRIDSILDPAGK